ncbi:hypothetical protein QQZ08_009230 [Neonectria magnoliae]|uniref:NmrA-like domain-containing protein n=1 Tax=Neonectria magnoliae TaxID=2732573 RepID=A0ABR1HQR1_9HYPO
MRVALVGATGETGTSVIDGLLKSSDGFVRTPTIHRPREFNADWSLQDLTALVRPSSLGKPAVEELKTRGVNVVSADLQGPQESLVRILKGIDVVISTIHYQALGDEIPLATAAKAAGVKRYVPCFFATVAPKGIMHLRDVKEDVLCHVQRLYLPYTVIDIGWWYQIALPRVPSGRFDYALLAPISYIFEGGETPIALTDVRDIGLYVAKIISDPKTINQKVFAFSECLTQNQVVKLVEKVSGEKVDSAKLSAKEIETSLSDIKRKDSDPVSQIQAMNEYWYSWGVRGDNSPEHAKYLGYLIAADLYPDLKGRSLETFVREVADQKARKVYSQ